MPTLVESPGVRSTISQDDGSIEEIVAPEQYDESEAGEEGYEGEHEEHEAGEEHEGHHHGSGQCGNGEMTTFQIEIVHPPQKGIAAWLAHLRRKNERRGALKTLQDLLF